MTGAIRIEVAGRPQGKGRPRFNRASGNAYTPAETRSYEAVIRYTAQAAMAGRRPIEGAARCDIAAYVPVPKSWSKKKQAAALAGEILPTVRPDWDNFAKTTDALNEIVWRDDCQITDSNFRKRYSDRPRMVIVATPVTLPVTESEL